MNDTADVSIGSSIFMLAPPVDGGARAPSLYRRRMTAVGFPGSSGSVCPDLSTTLPKGPPYPGGPFLHSSDNTPRSPPPLVHPEQPSTQCPRSRTCSARASMLSASNSHAVQMSSSSSSPSPPPSRSTSAAGLSFAVRSADSKGENRSTSRRSFWYVRPSSSSSAGFPSRPG